jgi:hypothetical protein
MVLIGSQKVFWGQKSMWVAMWVAAAKRYLRHLFSMDAIPWGATNTLPQTSPLRKFLQINDLWDIFVRVLGSNPGRASLIEGSLA